MPSIFRGKGKHSSSASKELGENASLASRSARSAKSPRSTLKTVKTPEKEPQSATPETSPSSSHGMGDAPPRPSVRSSRSTEEVSKDVDRLKRQLRDSNRLVAAVLGEPNKKKTSSSDSIRALQEFAAMKDELATVEKELSAALIKRNELETKVTHLTLDRKQKVTSLSQELEKQQRISEELEKKVQETNSALSSEFAVSAQSLEESRREIHDMKEQLEAAQARIRELEADREENMNDIVELQKELMVHNGNLANQGKREKKAASEVLKLQAEKVEYMNKVEDLDRQLAESKASIELLNAEKQNKEEDLLLQLKRKTQLLEQTLADSSEAERKLQDELKNKSQEFEEQYNQLKALEKELEKSDAQKDKIDSLCKLVVSQQAKLAEQDGIRKERDAKEDELKDMSRQLEESQSTIRQLEDTHKIMEEDLLERIELKTREVEKTKVELEEANRSNLSLQQNVNKYERKLEEIDVLRAEIDQLEEKHATEVEARRNAETQVGVMEEEVRQKVEENTAQSAKLHELSTLFVEQDNKLAEMEELRRQADEAKGLAYRVKDLDAELEQSKDSYRQLQSASFATEADIRNRLEQKEKEVEDTRTEIEQFKLVESSLREELNESQLKAEEVHPLRAQIRELEQEKRDNGEKARADRLEGDLRRKIAEYDAQQEELNELSELIVVQKRQLDQLSNLELQVDEYKALSELRSRALADSQSQHKELKSELESMSAQLDESRRVMAKNDWALEDARRSEAEAIEAVNRLKDEAEADRKAAKSLSSELAGINAKNRKLVEKHEAEQARAQARIRELEKIAEGAQTILQGMLSQSTTRRPDTIYDTIRDDRSSTSGEAESVKFDV